MGFKIGEVNSRGDMLIVGVSIQSKVSGLDMKGDRQTVKLLETFRIRLLESGERPGQATDCQEISAVD